MLVHLSLGSNVGNRRAHLEEAVRRLTAEGLRVRSVSSLYETEPQGRRDQPWFLNCVLEAETDLAPHEVLQRAQAVERAMGRQRGLRWGPRVIDVDLLLCGDRSVDDAVLTLPHPRMHERAFVLVPLAEVAPDVRVGRRGTASDLAILRSAEEGQAVRLWGRLEGWPGPAGGGGGHQVGSSLSPGAAEPGSPGAGPAPGAGRSAGRARGRHGARQERWSDGGPTSHSGAGSKSGCPAGGEGTPRLKCAAAGDARPSRTSAGGSACRAGEARGRTAGNGGATRAQVLARLQAASGEAVSGARLAREIGVSRAAVWKHVRQLRAQGYPIRGTAGAGYALPAGDAAATAPLTHGELLSPARRTVGRVLHLLRSVDSTNRVARQLGLQGSPDGTAVLADEQTAGRGRNGRSFLSPLGGVYLSVLLRPRVPPAQAVRLTLLGALAACEAVERVAGLQPEIKWPNDILLPGGKVCGVLLEMVAAEDCVDFVVLGCGVNVATLPAVSGAASLWSSGAPVTRSAVARALLDSLDEAYTAFTAGQWAELLGRWRRRCSTLGRRVSVASLDGELLTGRAVDVTLDGALLVEAPDGVHTVLAGDVYHLRGEVP